MSQRLPRPGGDNGDWGDILNAFLEVSLAADGTLNNNVVGTNQLQNNSVTNAQLDNSTQTILASVPDKYVKPGGGIPSTDMTTGAQLSLSLANTAVQVGGDIGGTTTSPVVNTVKGGLIPVTSSSPLSISSSPSAGQVLTAAVSAGNFPTTGILDTLNRSSEDPLSDGGKWSQFSTWTTYPLQIVTSGQVTATSSGFGAMYWNAATFADQEAYATLASLNSSDTIALFLRLNSPTGTWTGYRIKIILSGNITVYRSDGTNLGSWSVSLSQGDVIGARIMGSTISLYHNNALINSVTDSTYSSAGYIGLGVGTTSSALSNVGGGAVVESLNGSWTTPSTGFGSVTLSGTPSSGQVPTATGTTTATWQAVNGLGGVTLSGTPSSGMVPTATGTTTASWQTPTGGAVNTFTQSGSFTLTLAQANEIGVVTLSANATATIPAYASVAFPVGTILGFINSSSYTLNISPTSGVTLTSSGGSSGTVSLGTYSSSAVLNIGTDTWIVI